ncbi:AraC family transcriptional regulator [Gramella sp. KN1008]|uniref:helix-turn-helix domain-containing protein n=1 Tax=Gramella sp. KN1008 TaxID=2529298 RepID=UPI00103FBA55|nr:helix-turn-helix domain-containing protein [Gramella sp. KN1008]TBW29222.1 AraC family transcriptional regulator [Gramella sp. KN1008]
MLASFAKPVDYSVPKELVPYVKAVIHGSSGEKLNLQYPMFATGFPVMIYILDAPEIITNNNRNLPQDVLNIAGQIYNAHVSVSFKDQELSAIGIILSPTSTYYLFHKNGTELLNNWTGLKNIDVDAGDLRDKLSEAKTLESKIEVIFSFLIDLIPKKTPAIGWLDTAIEKIIMKEGHIHIKDLYDPDEISPRHFRRKFKEIIGMPPKYYCKVIQLNSVFRMINVGQSEKLNDIALDCGYFDQAHFIKDFKKHIGFAPLNFLNSKYSFLSSYLGVQ